MSLVILDPLTNASVVQPTFTIFPKTVLEDTGWSRNRFTAGTTIDAVNHTVSFAATNDRIDYTKGGTGSDLDLSAYTQFIVDNPSNDSIQLYMFVSSGSAYFGSSSTGVFDISGFTDRDKINNFFIRNKNAGSATVGLAGGEPHIVCLDNSRIDVYDDGIYRLFQDPVTSFAVNISVENTYISEVCAVDRHGVIAHLSFDIDSNRSLHANSINVHKRSDENVLDIVGEKGTDAILHAHGFKLNMQSKYRAVGVTADGQKDGDTVDAGGILAGLIASVPTIQSNDSAGSNVQVTLNKWTANALSCDAHFPHIVTFFGEQIVPGAGSFTLFELDGLAVRSVHDEWSRLDKLTIERDGATQLEARWSREASPPLQDMPPKVSMTVVGAAAQLEHDLVEQILPIGANGELLVRLQSNGAASFAVRNIDMGTWNPEANGLLAKRSVKEGQMNSAGTAASCTTSIYERSVEPHLAWRRGAATVDSTKVGCIGLK